MERPFGWAPCRLLTLGQLAHLSLPAKALYLGLCLAADRRGLSWWSEGRLGTQLGLEAHDLRRAREELVRQDLLAFDGRVYQLLSSSRKRPSVPPPPRQRSRERGEATEPTHIAAVLAPLMRKFEVS